MIVTDTDYHEAERDDCSFLLNGNIGTVEVVRPHYIGVTMELDSDGGRDWAFYEGQIKPFTIEAGKFYRTREGNRVGPMKDCGDVKWTDQHGDTAAFQDEVVNYYTADGLWLTRYGKPVDEDIVGLWAEPVAVVERVAVVEPALSPVKYEPKFKKGDRLECVDASDTAAVTLGEVYVAERDCYDGNAFVEIKNVGGMLSRRFRLVAPAKPKLKVGDRVRIARNNRPESSHLNSQIGREFTIKYADGPNNIGWSGDSEETPYWWEESELELVSTAPPAPTLPPVGTLVTFTGKLTGAQNNGGNVSVTFNTSTGGRSFDIPASAIRAA